MVYIPNVLVALGSSHMAQNEIPMFRLNRKSPGQKGVVATLEAQVHRVFRSQDLQRLFQEHREEWGVLSTVSWKSFLESLENELNLKQH